MAIIVLSTDAYYGFRGSIGAVSTSYPDGSTYFMGGGAVLAFAPVFIGCPSFVRAVLYYL